MTDRTTERAGGEGGRTREGGPIRVVLFYGPYLRSAHEFALRLLAHPDIELAAAYCAAPGESRSHQLSDLWKRRGALGLALFAFEVLRDAVRRVTSAEERAHRRRRAALAERVRYVEDLHAPETLAEVRALRPDLGLGYGGPILRPALFRIPRHGTLGIHHGRLPEYRGKKTTFWEIWEGEPTAGVTIQRIDEGIDTGEIVAQGSVPIAGRGYEAIWQDVQRLGLELYVDAVLSVRDGSVVFRRAAGEKGPLRSDPTPWDLLRLPARRLRRVLRRRFRGGGGAARGEPGNRAPEDPA